MTRYEYTTFRKHYEANGGKILSISKAIGKPRTTVRSWIEKMEQEAKIFGGLEDEIKRLNGVILNMVEMIAMQDLGINVDVEDRCTYEYEMDYQGIKDRLQEELEEEETSSHLELITTATEASTGKPYNKVDAYLLEGLLDIKGKAIQKFLREGTPLPQTVVKILQQSLTGNQDV